MANADAAALRIALRERGFASVSSDVLAVANASSEAEFASVRHVSTVASVLFISSR